MLSNATTNAAGPGTPGQLNLLVSMLIETGIAPESDVLNLRTRFGKDQFGVMDRRIQELIAFRQRKDRATKAQFDAIRKLQHRLGTSADNRDPLAMTTKSASDLIQSLIRSVQGLGEREALDRAEAERKAREEAQASRKYTAPLNAMDIIEDDEDLIALLNH